MGLYCVVHMNIYVNIPLFNQKIYIHAQLNATFGYDLDLPCRRLIY